MDTFLQLNAGCAVWSADHVPDADYIPLPDRVSQCSAWIRLAVLTKLCGAQITYQMLITSLYQTVLGMLATSQDFINSSNTAVSAVKALDSRAPADISQGSGSKRLLLQTAARYRGFGTVWCFNVVHLVLAPRHPTL